MAERFFGGSYILLSALALRPRLTVDNLDAQIRYGRNNKLKGYSTYWDLFGTCVASHAHGINQMVTCDNSDISESFWPRLSIGTGICHSWQKSTTSSHL